jgi:Tfp pilus assembly PilM family ATPase
MRAKEQPILGVEITPAEMRVAQIEMRGNKPVVTAAGWTRIPDSALARSGVQSVDTLALSLRKLLEQLGIGGGGSAVIGIPSVMTTVRTLTVPPVPLDELATIVAGEVEHYRIVNEGGAHCFVRLSPPARGSTEPLPVLVAAAEESVIVSLGAVAHASGFDLESLEPTQFGRGSPAHRPRFGRPRIRPRGPALVLQADRSRLHAAYSATRPT